jgi:hypothetical protein
MIVAFNIITISRTKNRTVCGHLFLRQLSSSLWPQPNICCGSFKVLCAVRVPPQLTYLNQRLKIHSAYQFLMTKQISSTATPLTVTNTFITPTNAQFCNQCILSLVLLLHVWALSLSPGRLHQDTAICN